MRPTHWLAVAAALILAIFIGVRTAYQDHGGIGIQPALASAIVDAHLRSLQPGHLETSSPRTSTP